MVVDLEDVYDVSQFNLSWEAAYGRAYNIAYWNGAEWEVVYSETNGDGRLDQAFLDATTPMRYVRVDFIERATEWGFSLWEFEVIGMASEGDFAELETEPTVEVAEAEPEMAITDSAVLFDFEEGLQGWEVATEWPQVTNAEVVDGALVMSGAWAGDEWNEGGVYIVSEDGWDLSAYDLLTVEVCAPEDAVDFFAQIFMRTTEELVWANNPGGTPEAGACTTYEATLADMGDMTDVRQIGVKIGTSATDFEGSFTIDNVQVSSMR